MLNKSVVKLHEINIDFHTVNNTSASHATLNT